MSYFYDLTQESVHFIEEEDSDADLPSTQRFKEKSHPGAATANATPAAKHDDSPCPKTTNDPEICQEEENSPFHAQAEEEKTNRVEGHVNQGGTPDPTYDSNLLQEHHNVLDLKSSSIKLLLLREDKSEQGDTCLVLEKIWDLKNPVEIGRRLSQSVGITNGLFNDRLVSRKHATVYVEGDKVVLQDVGSSHGTFVNGQRVLTCRELFDGDRLNLGQFSSGKAPYIVQIIRGANHKIGDDTKAEQCASSESKKRKHEADGIDDVAYFIFDSLDNVENRIVKRIRASSAISTIVGGVVGGLTVGCAIVGLANMG